MMIQFLLIPGTWQHQYWNQNEYTVVKLKEGGYGVLDHSIQTLIAKGDTEKECWDWIDGK